MGRGLGRKMRGMSRGEQRNFRKNFRKFCFGMGLESVLLSRTGRKVERKVLLSRTKQGKV